MLEAMPPHSLLREGADGVVVSSYRLSSPNGFDNRWLETTNIYCCALSGLRAPRARLR
jgi:hypothetical protein